ALAVKQHSLSVTKISSGDAGPRGDKTGITARTDRKNSPFWSWVNERHHCATLLFLHSIVRVTEPGERIRLQMAPSDTGSKFCQRPDKNTSSRVGGSVFTCLSRFQNMWLRRQQCSG
ncbi:Actin-2, partial [Dissostichus eleginoides]